MGRVRMYHDTLKVSVRDAVDKYSATVVSKDVVLCDGIVNNRYHERLPQHREMIE